MQINFNQITDVEVEGIDMQDYPKFCDAYIATCQIDGVDATDAQLNVINENSLFVYEQITEAIY
jgi:hypothetical protein|tara:strand:+ start:460 stop:651 length:192 start_codon:yes stop_codon:yes gene_type:complete